MTFEPMDDESESKTCPYCGEAFRPALDPTEVEGEMIQDCEVCCRPITIRFRFEGEDLMECELLGEDEV